MRARRRVFEVLELSSGSDRASSICDAALVTLISLNVLAAVLESVPSVGVPLADFFHAFDLVSVAIFSVEYLLRLWSCVESGDLRFRKPVIGRMRYAVSLAALIDLLAVLPFYLAAIAPIDLRFLRVMRLLRIFKLTHYFSALNILLDVIRVERHAFGAAFFLLIIGVLFASSGIYLFEHDVQPEAFGSIPAAMWWAVATLTTVGYGDVTPITAAGKIFGSSITVLGIGTVALPSGILASGFGEALRRRQNIYRDHVRTALEDGVIDAREEEELSKLRKDLGLQREEVEGIGQERRADAAPRVGRLAFGPEDKCPHCGERLLEEPEPGTP